MENSFCIRSLPAAPIAARSSSSSMSVAIATLMDDDELRAAMGAAGRERMQNEFSIATMADRHVALYETLLEKEEKK